MAYKPLKKRYMTREFDGPLSKMINKAVEERVSSMLKNTEEGERKLVDERTTRTDTDEGFERTTERDYEVKTKKDLPTYKEAWDNMSPEEKEKFGDYENFVKEAEESPATEEQRYDTDVETESETRTFKELGPLGQAVHSDPRNYRIIKTPDGETKVITKGEAKKMQHNNPDLEVMYPNKENAEAAGVDFRTIGTGFKDPETGNILSEHDAAGMGYTLNDFGRVDVRNRKNPAGTYTETTERKGGDVEKPPMNKLKYTNQGHMLNNRTMSFRKKL